MKDDIYSSKKISKKFEETLPLKINELFYVVIFILLHYFELLKNNVLKLKKKVTYNLIENLPIQNVQDFFNKYTIFK